MGWKGVFIYLLYLASLGESTSRSAQFLPISLSAASSSLYSWAVCSAAIFVVVAFVLSMYLIFEHLAAYNQLEEQKFLMGLILMVPVYALESFLFLLHSDAAFNCEIIQDCYEAFALYCIERYLIACLVVCSYPYLAVLSFSRTWALHYLVLSYSVTKIKLARIKPLAKFLTFNSIVFLTWWQGVAVAFLFSFGALKGIIGAGSEKRIQDYIICIEIVDDMKFTVSHVVEPVERGIAKINRTFRQISENGKRNEERKKNPKTIAISSLELVGERILRCAQ